MTVILFRLAHTGKLFLPCFPKALFQDSIRKSQQMTTVGRTSSFAICMNFAIKKKINENIKFFWSNYVQRAV